MSLIVTTEEDLRAILRGVLQEILPELTKEPERESLGYTTEEACARFDVSPATLYRRRKDGSLSYCFGLKGEIRYRREDIERFYARRAVRAVGESNVLKFDKAA